MFLVWPQLFGLVYKEFLSAFAIALTFIAFFPYIHSILKGQTRPHVFSWIIWGSTTFVVFLAQLADKGGAGAWPTGVSGVITIYVALLAYRKKSDNSVTTIDWLFFIVAMSSLPLWYVTSDPLWAVVVLTSVDVIGFVPGFRKAYHYPFDEDLRFFVIIVVRNFIAIMALAHFSLTTVLFPLATAVASLLYILMVMLRRRVCTS
jgi:hypothetical protein